jgi:GT2 family glycosyltransferase
LSGSIDIIIPTFARKGSATLLINSIGKILTPCDCIYVVWQGTEKPVETVDGNVHFIRSSPPNLPKARNRGIAEGKGDIILFLDDDVEILCEDFLEIHRKAYSSPGIGAVAGYIDDPLFVNQGASCSVYDETTGEIIQNFSVNQSQDTISFMGAHISIKREAIAGIGGFDEKFKGNALWEDIDCAFRIRKAGWRISYCPEAKVRHLRGQKGGCRANGRIVYTYNQFANTAYFAARHAQKKHYHTWFIFWIYRLEYLSRRHFLWFRHDPLMVMAAMAGALGGIARCLLYKKNKILS